MQMLLFEHAVNRSREQSGRAAVDSVWLWGGGALVPRDAPAVQIFADAGLIYDLSRSAGLVPAPLPVALDAVPSATAQVFWLDAIGIDAAATRLAALDRAWLAPAEHALHAGTIREVELVIAGPACCRDRAARAAADRRGLRCRWRDCVRSRRAGLAGDGRARRLPRAQPLRVRLRAHAGDRRARRTTRASDDHHRRQRHRERR